MPLSVVLGVSETLVSKKVEGVPVMPGVMADVVATTGILGVSELQFPECIRSPGSQGSSRCCPSGWGVRVLGLLSAELQTVRACDSG